VYVALQIYAKSGISFSGGMQDMQNMATAAGLGLKEFSEKKQFKSFEQLKSRLDKVLGFDGAPVAPKTKATDNVVSSIKDDDVSVIDKAISADDEDLDYFKSLAESN
jgi:hypothetical protein